MPQIEVAKDYVIGYKIVNKSARDAAWVAAWDAAWVAAWDATRDSTRVATWVATWDATRDATRVAAWDAARVATWDAAWDAAWVAARVAARDSTRVATWVATRDAARVATWDAAWGAALANVEMDDNLVVTRFFEIEMEMLKAFEAGLDIYFPMQDKLILVPTPRFQVEMIDNRVRLHSIEKPAVDFRGGLKYYFIHGVKFEKLLWKKIINKSLSSKEVLGLENIEQRREAIRYYGIETLFDSLNAKLIDKSQKYELYCANNLFRNFPKAYYLKYKDPSTKRVYVSGIAPQIGSQKDAILAMAWKFHLEKDFREGGLFDHES